MKAPQKTVRMVDLFAGCGGLSLGFELYTGSVEYRSVLALDNSAQAIRVYNDNDLRPDGALPTARLCDLTWFSHPSEVLLYYLVHFALHQPEPELRRALEAIGIAEFLGMLGRVDAEAAESFTKLARSAEYRASLEDIEAGTSSTAIFKIFQNKLGFSSIKSVSLSDAALPWREECLLPGLSDRGRMLEKRAPINAIAEDTARFWDAEVAMLGEASEKEGRGANQVVSRRMKTFVAFLRSSNGAALRKIWVSWRMQRDSIRARFCTEKAELINTLYTEERRVHMILGGPPCKGFSRIGRAVIESLRDQGVHAWASHEYGDERNALLHKYVLFLEALRPEVFVFENVAHFKSALRTPTGQLDATRMLEEAIETLSTSKLHFHVASSIVRAREHGIPQDRERFIMFGVNATCADQGVADRFFSLRGYQEPVPLQSALQGLAPPGEFAWEGTGACKTDHQSRAYTLVDESMPEAMVRYIKWIRQPAPDSLSAPVSTDAHVVRRLRTDDLALLSKFAPGQRWMDYKLKHSETLQELRSAMEAVLLHQQKRPVASLPSIESLTALLGKVNGGLFLRLLLEEVVAPLDVAEHHLLSSGYLAKGDDMHGDWFERLSASRPCKTIVAHIGKDTYGYFHPYENRALSIREAARVQSFPDFFKFGSVGVVDGYSIIGNAVPPLLANVFAAQLAKIYFAVDRNDNDQEFSPPKISSGRSRQLEMGLQ